MAPLSPASHVPLLVHNRSRFSFRIHLPVDANVKVSRAAVVTPQSAPEVDRVLAAGASHAALINVPLGNVLKNKTVKLHLQEQTYQDETNTLSAQAASAPVALSVKLNPTAQSPELVLSATEIRSSASLSDKWQAVKIESEHSVWALQSVPSGNTPASLILFSTRPSESFLSTVPDSVPLSALCLPGTHESLARYGWPVSTCQEEASTVAAQLTAGIRYFDVRLVPKGDGANMRLLAYHGITDQRIEFGAVLSQVFAWLDGPGKRDTIIMSLKQEAGPTPPVFDNLLASMYVQPNASRWFLDPRIPTLGEARGKIVMVSRFGTSAQQPGGIHPTTWPNSSPSCFTFTTPSSQLVEIEDWYDIGMTSNANLTTKISIISQLLTDVGSNAAALGIAYCNGSSFPGALPFSVAKGLLGVTGMNDRLLSIVATKLQLPLPSSSAPVAIADIPAQAHDASEPQPGRWDRLAIFKNKTENLAPVTPAAPVYDPPARAAGLSVTFPIDYFGSTPTLVPLLIEANFAPGT